MGLDGLLTRPQLCHNQVQVHLPTDTQDKQEQKDVFEKLVQVESRVKLKHEITILFIRAQSINILLQKEWLNQFCNKSNSAGASFDLNEKSTWYQMVIWQRFLPCGSESLPNSHLVPRAFFKVKSHGARENIQV